ncbi:MAG: hypothetical protein ACAH83_09135 [Alphaproteobacteria bacterium]
MKSNSKLTQEFKRAMDDIRSPEPKADAGPFRKLEERTRKGFAVTSKKKFMKELDKRLRLLAEELPGTVGPKGFEYLVKMPGKIHFNKSALSVWRGRRKAFDVTYDDLRHLSGVKQLVKMAEEADVKMGVQLFSFNAHEPSRELADVNEPTPKERMPWTMKRDAGTFTEVNVYFDVQQKFDPAQFPKKPAPKGP